MSRAFIKQYAEAVGLDPDEFLKNLKMKFLLHMHDDLPEQLSRVKTRTIAR